MCDPQVTEGVADRHMRMILEIQKMEAEDLEYLQGLYEGEDQSTPPEEEDRNSEKIS